MLLRVEITDPALVPRDGRGAQSIRVLGSKAYLRFQTRKSPEAGWSSVTIDLASA